MRKVLHKKEFETIQVESNIKQQIAEYCDERDIKYATFIKKMFQFIVSGSVSL